MKTVMYKSLRGVENSETVDDINLARRVDYGTIVLLSKVPK
jgi:hypothetical protein